MSRKTPAKKPSPARGKTPARPAPRYGGPQKYLLLACVGTSIAATGLVGYLLWKGPTTKTRPPEDLPTTGDLRALGMNQPGGIGAARGLSVEFTDKDDPTRLRGTLTSKSIEPLREQTYAVEDPRIWMFEDDGRFVYLEAPAGRLVMPDGRNPRSGFFSGGVVYRVFEARTDGSRPDPLQDAALMEGRTPTLQFDLSVGEGYAPQDVEIVTPELTFKGRDVKVVLDEVRDRLKYLEVRAGGTLSYVPPQGDDPALLNPEDFIGPEPGGRRGPKPNAPPQGQQPGSEPSRQAPGLPEHEPGTPAPHNGTAPGTQAPTGPQAGGTIETPAAERRKRQVRTHYRLTFLDQVQVTQGAMEIASDKLEAWALVINNRLPANALGERSGPASTPAAPPPPPPHDVADEPERRFIPVPTGGGVGGYFEWCGPEAVPSPARDVAPRDEPGAQPAPAGRDQDGGTGGPGAGVGGPLFSVAAAAIAQPGAGPDVVPGHDATSPPPEAPGSAGAAASLAPGETVTLTWAGRLVIEPLPSKPAELSGDHVALRFSADKTGLVRFKDEESGAFGQASTLDYHATQRLLTLTSPGLNAVRLTLPESGRLECNRVELSMASGTGIVRGPGQVSALEPGQSEPDPASLRRLAWSEQADFQFRMRDGRLDKGLEWARFEGGIRVGDPRGNLSARALTATFGAAEDAQHAPPLRQVKCEGGVVAGDSEGGTLTTDLVVIDFTRDSTGTDVPSFLSAEGSVIARRDDAELRAGVLDAWLARGEDERVRVSRMVASHDVAFSRASDRTRARAERLEADAAMEVVTILGAGSYVAQGDSVIDAAQIVLGGERGRLEVFGPGEFRQEHAAPDGAAAPSAALQQAPGAAEPLARATWKTEMVFDDETGSLECFGGVVARHNPEPGTTEVIEAERVKVALTARGAAGPDALSLRDTKAERQVLSVHAVGGSMLIPGGRPAVVQTLREGEPAEPGGPRPILRLLRLEAPEVFADNTLGTVRVDHAGRLVLADFSPVDPTRPGESAGAEQPSDVRGSALFEWGLGLVVDRAQGTIKMHQNVTMVHQRAADGRRTNLLCQDLIASVMEEPAEPAPAAPGSAPGADPLPGGATGLADLRFSLNRVLATGSVHLISGTRELVARQVDYDAATGTADATAAPNDVVTYFDTESPTPITATRLWWDLTNNRIEVRNPGPVVAPRRGG